MADSARAVVQPRTAARRCSGHQRDAKRSPCNKHFAEHVKSSASSNSGEAPLDAGDYHVCTVCHGHFIARACMMMPVDDAVWQFFGERFVCRDCTAAQKQSVADERAAVTALC